MIEDVAVVTGQPAMGAGIGASFAPDAAAFRSQRMGLPGGNPPFGACMVDAGQLHMLTMEHLGLMGVMHRPGAGRDVGGAGALDAAGQRGKSGNCDQKTGTGHESNLSTEAAGFRRQGWYVMARLNAR